MTENKRNGDGDQSVNVAVGTDTNTNSEANGKKRADPGSPNQVKENDRNNLRQFRIEQMMSKAELARKAGLSVLTIDRIEKGFGCRMDTKRKILKALGLKLSDRRQVFKDE